MANFIELIASKQAKDDLDFLESKLKLIVDQITKVNDAVIVVGKSISSVKTPGGLSSFSEGNANNIAKAQSATDKYTQSVERQRLAELKLQMDREKAFDRYEEQQRKASEQSAARSQRESKAYYAAIDKKQQLEFKERVQAKKDLDDEKYRAEQKIILAQKEAEANEKAANVYNKIQAKVNALIPEYNNLSAKRELGVKLTDQEAKRVDFLTGKLTGYQNILKKVDADVGKHQREVGNYAKANGNLSNSLSQIARELPNFGQSFSIGVLSLTNNIGALIDGLKQVKLQNAALKAEGKETSSVLSQVLKGIFSWQTALFVGIGIFSAYSGQIGEFFSTLIHGKKALDELSAVQTMFNEKRLESSARTKQDIQNMTEYIRIARNSTGIFTEDQVLVAFQKIREAGKYYFKDLKDSEIFAEKGREALEKFTNAIEAQAKAQDLLSANESTNKRINALQAEVEARDSYEKKRTEALKKSNDIAKSAGLGEIEKNKLIEKSVERIYELEEKRRKLRDSKKDQTLSLGYLNEDTGIQNSIEIRQQISILIAEELKQRKQINDQIEKSIVLDYKNEKAVKAKKTPKEKEDNSGQAVLAARLRYLKALEDASQQEYEYQKTLKENEISDIEKLANDEKRSFEQRLDSYSLLLNKKQELLKFNNDYQLIQLRKQKNVELTESDKALASELKQAGSHEDAKKKIRNYYQQERKEIESKFNSERLKTNAVYNDQYLKLAEDVSKAELLIIQKRNDILKETEKIKRDYETNIFKKTADDEKQNLDVRQIAFREYINLKQEQLDKDRTNAESAASNDIENLKKVKAQYDVLQADLNSEKTTQSPFVKTLKEANAEIEKMQKTLQSDFLSSAGLSGINTFLDGSFKKLIEGLDLIEDPIERSRKKFSAYFQSISESAQQTVNFLSQLWQGNAERDEKRLEKQNKLALKFAGDNTAAQEHINEQFEQRQREIKKREAEGKKRLALINIAIDTAQAVVAAVAASPLTGGLPFSAIAIGIGAIQAAVVASQQIPEFKDGGVHKGGLMKINDAPGSDYREIIKTPDGNLSSYEDRNVIINKPAGTEIFTQKQWWDKRSKELAMQGILSPSSKMVNMIMAIPSNGITEQQFNAGINRLAATYSNAASASISANAKGIHLWKSENGKRVRVMNNYLNVRSSNNGR